MIVVSDTSPIIGLAAVGHLDLLLLDQRKARAVARRLGRPVVGVLGMLVEAKRRQLLPAVRPVRDELLTRAGFRISEALRSRVLQEAGETD